MKILPTVCSFFLFFPMLSRAQTTPPTIEQLNAAFGLPIWQDENLFDDEDSAVAARINWPRESKTSEASIYRLYADNSTQILGARPFSLALYGEQDHVSEISMIFANKGDITELVFRGVDMSDLKKAEREAEKNKKNYKKFIQEDASVIEKKLTELLGKPTSQRIGQGREMTEQSKRWDWNGQAITLAAPKGEYVAVRIQPAERLDGPKDARVADAEIREKLAARVEHRPNGDVILTDIPMIDQGPKGYCMPATWERVMRYLGIPGEMYVLAMAGSSNVGGGTSADAITAGAGDAVRLSGRRISQETGKMKTQFISKYIDKGLPLMWMMFVDEDLNRQLTDRAAQRKAATDWDAWEKSLDPNRKAARRIRTNRENGHVCMIVGYNDKTKEIAISDSWGPQFAERWITEEEADAISQGRFIIIAW